MQLGSRSKTISPPKRTPAARRGAPRGAGNVTASRAPARTTIASAPDEAGARANTTPPEVANRLRDCSGSDYREFANALLRSTLASLAPIGVVDGKDSLDKHIDVALVALGAFHPADELEGMIAAQCIGLHQAAMECFRRAMIVGQPVDVSSKLRRDAANMARGMTDMLDALDRKRGKTQVVRVERVVVNDGGQAIVGTVAAAAAVSGKGEGGAGGV